MQIPNESLDQFIQIYKEEYGEEISHSEASKMASQVIALYELLAKKLPNEQTSKPKPPDEPPRTMGFLS